MLNKILIASGLLTLSLLISHQLYGQISNSSVEFENKINHKLTHVRVYTSRAELTHEGSTLLQAGEHSVVFSGLSQFTDDASIQVTGVGEGIIQEVSPRISYLNRTSKTQKLKNIEDSLKIFMAELNDVGDQMNVLESENAIMNENNKLGGTEKGFTAEELDKLASLYILRVTANKKAYRKLQFEKDKLSLIINRLQNEKNNVSRQRDAPTKEVIIRFSKPSAGKVSFILKYLVSNANWSPFYDVRCTKVNAPIEINLKAKVINDTGIDWDNVNLSLSTADPTLNSEAPLLDPLYLYVRNIAAYSNYNQTKQLNSVEIQKGTLKLRSMPKKDQESGAEEDVENAPPSPATSMAPTVETTSSSLSTEYAINTKYTIPSDRQSHSVEVKKNELPGSYRYFAIPKKDKDAFLQFQLTDWNNYDLIPGPANVYFEGSFVANTYINPNSATDTFYIGLGRDRKVVIERKLDKKYSSQKSIGSTTKLERSYKVQLRNNKTESILLTIEDQVPLSSGSNIEVELKEKSGANYDATTGKLKWELELSPGQSKILDFGYTIKYPKGMNLYSGDGGTNNY